MERRECRTTSSCCKERGSRKETAASQSSNRKGKITSLLRIPCGISFLKDKSVLSERYDSCFFNYCLSVIIKFDKLCFKLNFSNIYSSRATWKWVLQAQDSWCEETRKKWNIFKMSFDTFLLKKAPNKKTWKVMDSYLGIFC